MTIIDISEKIKLKLSFLPQKGKFAGLSSRPVKIVPEN
jgi:hypothetical protein